MFDLDYPGLQSSSAGPVVFVSAELPSADGTMPFPMTEVPDSLLVHLSPEPLLQSDDPAIVALADSLTSGCADSWEAAAAICRFVDTAVEDVPTVSLPSAVDVLDAMRGDCNEHTALFVALARAAGIPAAVCNGIVYIDEGRFGYHAWPAVWVGRWVAMDPTFGMLLADATHIILAMGSLEDQYTINAVIGRLSVREITE
jgi:transglutaminase-like putative cysteine protease